MLIVKLSVPVARLICRLQVVELTAQFATAVDGPDSPIGPAHPASIGMTTSTHFIWFLNMCFLRCRFSVISSETAYSD